MCKWAFLFWVPSKAMSIWLNKFPFLFLDLEENCFIGWFTTFVETFAFLSFSFPFFVLLSSLVSLPLSFLSFFPQVFAWLDLSWNKSDSTQSWILSSQNPISFLICRIGINLLLPLLDLPQLYQCFWFSFSKKQLVLLSQQVLFLLFSIFVVFYFCFNSHILSTFFTIFFSITLYFRSFLYNFFFCKYIWFTMLNFKWISEWFSYADTYLFFWRLFSIKGYYMILRISFLSFFFPIDGLGIDLSLFSNFVWIPNIFMYTCFLIKISLSKIFGKLIPKISLFSGWMFSFIVYWEVFLGTLRTCVYIHTLTCLYTHPFQITTCLKTCKCIFKDIFCLVKTWNVLILEICSPKWI